MLFFAFPARGSGHQLHFLNPYFHPPPLRKAQATTDKSISRLPGPRLLISDPRILLPPPKTLQAPPPPPSARPNQTNPEIFSHLLWYNYSSSFGPILVLPLAQLIASVFSGQPYSCLTSLSFPSRNVVVRFHHF